MRRVRFADAGGMVRVGEWNEDSIRHGGSHFDPEDVDVLPPSEPTKIVCVALNYSEHAAEADENYSADMNVPDRPFFFMKGPNAVLGHGSTATIPRGKELIHHEAELGVVMGEQCAYVTADEALDYVLGYTCVNDISNRDDQRQTVNGNIDWVRGKAFDHSLPIGPVVVDPEDVPPDANVQLRVNGEIRQDFSIENLVFSVPELVAEASHYMTLEPGDVIAAGTSTGAGPLEDGDEVDVEVEGVGTLTHYMDRDQ